MAPARSTPPTPPSGGHSTVRLSTGPAVLLTAPRTAASYLWPQDQALPAGPLTLLDETGGVVRADGDALAPYRLSGEQAGEQARRLLADPDRRAALLRELGDRSGEAGELAQLNAVLNAETPEAFAAAFGPPGTDPALLTARLDALAARLQEAVQRGVLELAPGAEPDAATPLPAGLARDPQTLPTFLALFGALVQSGRPTWPTPAPAWTPPELTVTSAPLPAFSYADLLGRDVASPPADLLARVLIQTPPAREDAP